MARKENIDRILRDWPYDPHGISVRKKKGDDGREVLQMRLDLGMLAARNDGPARTASGRRAPIRTTTI